MKPEMDALREPLNPQGFRDLFPSLSRRIHVASCSFAPPSVPLLAAQLALTTRWETGEAPWQFYESELDRFRQLLGSLIGSPAEHIAVQPNASVAAFQAASTVDWQERGGIVASATEFPSLAQVWHRMSTDVRLVESDRDGAISVPGFLEAIDSTTGLVSVPLVAYKTGARATIDDLTVIAARAHQVGAVLLVDAYQALGVLPCDVSDVPYDFLVGGSMKYLLGLPGVAFLYAREPARGRSPTLTGWFGRPNPFAFDPTDVEFPAQARRFETGTPAFPLICAANTGLELVARADPHRIWRHVSELVENATAELTASGVEIVTPRNRGPIVAVRTLDAVGITARLASHLIVASPRGDVVRLAFHYFNTHDDVLAITKALRG